MFKIKMIFGAVCSGKSSFITEHYAKIDIGDIVRSITKTNKRIHKPDLDKIIIEKLTDLVLYTYRRRDDILGIAIVGCRQVSILQAVEELCRLTTFHLERVLLYVPHSILKTRFEQRQSYKDVGMTFEEVMSRDVQIGYLELVEYLNLAKTFTITNYTKDEADTLQTCN